MIGTGEERLAKRLAQRGPTPRRQSVHRLMVRWSSINDGTYALLKSMCDRYELSKDRVMYQALMCYQSKRLNAEKSQAPTTTILRSQTALEKKA